MHEAADDDALRVDADRADAGGLLRPDAEGPGRAPWPAEALPVLAELRLFAGS